LDLKAVNQGVDGPAGIVSRCGGQVGVSRCCQNADMAQDLLELNKVNPCLQQMGRITVAQGMTGDFFLMPMS